MWCLSLEWDAHTGATSASNSGGEGPRSTGSFSIGDRVSAATAASSVPQAEKLPGEPLPAQKLQLLTKVRFCSAKFAEVCMDSPALPLPAMLADAVDLNLTHDAVMMCSGTSSQACRESKGTGPTMRRLRHIGWCATLTAAVKHRWRRTTAKWHRCFVPHTNAEELCCSARNRWRVLRCARLKQSMELHCLQ